MRIIGDIHGKIPEYLGLIEGQESSIQVGDFGMGFITHYEKDRVDVAHRTGNHRFIRGNHDDPALCRTSPGWIEDGYYDPDWDMMFMGGAWSIDHEIRRLQDARFGTTSWWPDEELALDAILRVHAEFVYRKPKVMITHDAPIQAAREMFFNGKYSMFAPYRSTRTAEALQAMFYEHQPDLWIFGHWHNTEQKTINGTKFICLAELDHIDI